MDKVRFIFALGFLATGIFLCVCIVGMMNEEMKSINIKASEWICTESKPLASTTILPGPNHTMILSNRLELQCFEYTRKIPAE
jgi:hypothetical protein